VAKVSPPSCAPPPDRTLTGRSVTLHHRFSTHCNVGSNGLFIGLETAVCQDDLAGSDHPPAIASLNDQIKTTMGTALNGNNPRTSIDPSAIAVQDLFKPSQEHVRAPTRPNQARAQRPRRWKAPLLPCLAPALHIASAGGVLKPLNGFMSTTGNRPNQVEVEFVGTFFPQRGHELLDWQGNVQKR
jgi:hypothetical protein